eukprot:7580814-Pyramimonas_sp.AAC.1
MDTTTPSLNIWDGCHRRVLLLYGQTFASNVGKAINCMVAIQCGFTSSPMPPVNRSEDPRQVFLFVVRTGMT